MHFDLNGPAGRLEALIDLPEGQPRAAVVLAHPLADYGGTLRSRVVHEAAKGFRRVGAVVLRFNFRGVGTSQGDIARGASEGTAGALDFQAALDALAARHPALPLWAAGYSFGAWISMLTGAADPRVSALVGIAPPVEHYDFSRLCSSATAKFIVQAERDELCSLRAMRRFYATLGEPKELVVIEGADHAFDGLASSVGDAIVDLLETEGRPRSR